MNNEPDYDNLYFEENKMTDLTEQWKKGELPEGVYYVIYYKNDTPEVDIYRQIFSLHNKPTKNFTINQVTKVLAPVPSYDEWKKTVNENIRQFDIVKMLEKDNFNLEKQNAQLKEMLKECVKMNTRLENALWQWNEESKLYDENEALENKINEVLNA